MPNYLISYSRPQGRPAQLRGLHHHLRGARDLPAARQGRPARTASTSAPSPASPASSACSRASGCGSSRAASQRPTRAATPRRTGSRTRPSGSRSASARSRARRRRGTPGARGRRRSAGRRAVGRRARLRPGRGAPAARRRADRVGPRGAALAGPGGVRLTPVTTGRAADRTAARPSRRVGPRRGMRARRPVSRLRGLAARRPVRRSGASSRRRAAATMRLVDARGSRPMIRRPLTAVSRQVTRVRLGAGNRWRRQCAAGPWPVALRRERDHRRVRLPVSAGRSTAISRRDVPSASWQADSSSAGRAGPEVGRERLRPVGSAAPGRSAYS